MKTPIPLVSKSHVQLHAAQLNLKASETILDRTSERKRIMRWRRVFALAAALLLLLVCRVGSETINIPPDCVLQHEDYPVKVTDAPADCPPTTICFHDSSCPPGKNHETTLTGKNGLHYVMHTFRIFSWKQPEPPGGCGQPPHGGDLGVAYPEEEGVTNCEPDQSEDLGCTDCEVQG